MGGAAAGRLCGEGHPNWYVTNPAAKTSPAIAAQAGRCRPGTDSGAVSRSSRLTADSAPGGRQVASYSPINGSGSALTTAAIAPMCPRA